MTTRVKQPSGRAEITEALLAAADRMFMEQSPADVSLRAIAREAGVNHGTVHRYFGTRDDLIEQLLVRLAARWTAKAQSAPDFASAIDLVLGDDSAAEASPGSWLRLLAWSMLTDSFETDASAHKRYATLDLLPGMLDEDDDREAAFTTAAALSMAFGWRFFHPYLRAALHLEDVDYADLQEAIRRNARRLV